jgi:hypothetical protein
MSDTDDTTPRTEPRTDQTQARESDLSGLQDDDHRSNQDKLSPTPDTATDRDQPREAGLISETSEGNSPATLIAPERARDLRAQWSEIKGEFVDEPRHAVGKANSLVGDVLDEIEQIFRQQRAELEKGLDDETTSTEDLRQALGRYHGFFDRLLSF